MMTNPIARGQALNLDQIKAAAAATQQRNVAIARKDEGAQIALKDVTHIYVNGQRAMAHALKVARDVCNMRRVLNIATTVTVQETTLIPRGSFVYCAGELIFAHGVHPGDPPPAPIAPRKADAEPDAGSPILSYLLDKLDQARSEGGRVQLESLGADDLQAIVDALEKPEQD